ncbi:metal-sensitive transcriptional regulator [Dietzia aerolata]|uniref:Metal-sensitive transcriptional regulator n=1 Tax=Dietzia aerolata TaxID=595984 RepID=A0ABV5JRD1_9ACTN|nr:metal-sensitive transcriptional regulator [Dietzia aerolata]MBB0968114.1 metal-sensitive transcriptional regulator [Dietzia aerolata]HIW68524.1 metal-sensitive transcriptional regulator [Candidatus Dietzia merdigallinarum]
MATTDPRQQVLNRLRRARGQLNAVIDMVEQEKSCKEIVTQLAAVSKALDRAGFKIISENIQECVIRDGEPDEDGVTLDELEKLFLSLA